MSVRLPPYPPTPDVPLMWFVLGMFAGAVLISLF